ncbi:MAG TPA: chemotaxis protein CheR [Lachnospiraceae bacterium]|nr:chemotaxis protein CheR [Lachnospiraceae bacterium]
MTLTEKDFLRLYTYIHKNYGINLSKKKQLIEGRLGSTLLSNGFANFTQYVDFILTKANKNDIDVMLNKLTTNYTFFMREQMHFDYFRDTILPYLVEKKKDKVLSIWSAGCSTGQEPYTLSILMKEFLGHNAAKWDTRVLATDISQNVLTQAQAGIYSADSLKEMPTKWVKKYFKKLDDGRFEVTPELKSSVIFKTFNLMDPIKFRLQFDVVFCRNVMIYFDQPTKDALVNRFYGATNNGGYLLIGHSEALNKVTTPYKYLMPATYRKI